MKYRDLQDRGGWSYRQMEDGTIFFLSVPSGSDMAGKSLTSGSNWQAITSKFNSSGIAWVAGSNANSGSNANANANAGSKIKDAASKVTGWLSTLLAPANAPANVPVNAPAGQNTGITRPPPTFMQQYGTIVAIGGVGLVVVIAVMAMKGGDDD